MKMSENFDESYEVEEQKAARISFHMIAKRNIEEDVRKMKEEEIECKLNKVTHLRLDRENIGHIDHLELLGPNVKSVYLQHNRIQRIANLDCLTNLTFLTLANNQISKIEGLLHLKKLGFLDLSQNQIKSFDIDELPQSLVILSLRDNPCSKLPDYRGSIIQDLPKLRQLDGKEINKIEKLEAGYRVSSSSEEETDEEDESFDMDMEPYRESIAKAEDAFKEAATDILLRSQRRLETALLTHNNNIAQLDDIRIHENLPPSARTPSVRVSASARLSASRSSAALREQLRSARSIGRKEALNS